MKKPTESEALEFLDKIDAELAATAASSGAEVEAAQRSLDAHRAALSHFRSTDEGLTPAIAATAFFRNLYELIHPGVTHIGRSVDTELKQYLAGRADSLARRAREIFIRHRSRDIADACAKIVQARTEHRDAWRNQIGDVIAALVKRQTLTSLDRAQGATVEGRLVSLKNMLADRDAEFQEANRLISRLRSNFATDDILDIYNGATSFARQMKSYEVVVALAEAA